MMSGEVCAVRRAKVPVFWTLNESFSALVAIGGVMALQVVIFALAQIIASMVAGSLPGFVGGFLEAVNDDPSAGGGAFKITAGAEAVGAVVGFLLLINLALTTSRWVLFRERPAVLSIFHWGRRQWRLLGVSLLCVLIILVPIIALAFAVGYLGGPELVTAALYIYPLLFLLLCPIFFWAMGWMSLTAPLIASDGPAFAIRRAWQLSRGNQLRLAAFFVLASLLTMIVIPVLELLLQSAVHMILPEVSRGAVVAKQILRLIVAGAVQVWTAAAMAVAYTVLTGVNERPVGGFPAQPG